MWGRLFSLAVAATAYVLSLVWGSSVFDIAAVAFSGYVTLTPTLFFGVRWKRFTASAAIASLCTGSAVLYLGLAGWIPLAGFLPVFWAFVAALVTAIVVTKIGQAGDPERIARAFGA